MYGCDFVFISPAGCSCRISVTAPSAPELTRIFNEGNTTLLDVYVKDMLGMTLKYFLLLSTENEANVQR
jgi:hypothetical protein